MSSHEKLDPLAIDDKNGSRNGQGLPNMVVMKAVSGATNSIESPILKVPSILSQVGPFVI